MDAIVLAPMPQNPVQSPGQSGQTAGRNDAPFGPVLSSAINGSGSGQKSPAAGTTPETAAAASEQFIDIEQIDDPGELEAFLAANNLTFEKLPAELQAMIAAAFPNFAAAAGSQLTGKDWLLPPGMSLYPHEQMPQGLDRLLAQLPDGGNVRPLPPPGQAVHKQELTLILSQLQQIISANETGTAIVEQLPADAVTLDDLAALTIGAPAAGNAARTAMASQATASPAGLFVLQPASPSAAPAGIPTAETAETAIAANQQPVPSALAADVETAGTQSATTLRQEMQSVTGAGNVSVADENEQAGRQNAQQDNNPATLQSGTTAAAGPASQTDQPVQTGVFSASLQESATAQQAQSHSGTITLPSGTTVSEQQIINQVVQRFQMTARLQSTRINIRLHPAELGELRIDLVVKEGSIKASVFAQNQQAQEILERNMPKLRSTLEQQGFTIDEIVVAFRAETTTDFDLFDGRSARGQHFSFSDNTSPQLATFEAALDSSLAGAQASDAGLSIRA